MPCSKLSTASNEAGHSLKQGIQTVVDEGQEPASKELERRHPALGLEGDEPVRDRAAHDEGDQDLEGLTAAQRCEDADQEAAPNDQVRELDRAQRQVGPLELPLQLQPHAAVRERLLGRPE